MLKPILDFGKQVANLTRDTQQNKEDIKTLRQEVKDVRQENAVLRQEMNQIRLEFGALTRTVERMMFEVKQTQQQSENAQRVMRLEMEVAILRYGRGLPAPDRPPEENPDA